MPGLFDPLTIRGDHLPQPHLGAAHVPVLAASTGTACPTDWHLVHLGSFAPRRRRRS